MPEMPMAEVVAPGRRLCGRYEVGALLGRGSTGEVRAGVDLRLGRPVALKLLVRSASPDGAEAEARAAARLVHPNIVVIFDAGEADGIPFVVMERLSGRTLADAIARGPFGFDDLRSVALQVLAALAVAHEHGIVHRDVKPGNVLAAERGTWKIGDFGIASPQAPGNSGANPHAVLCTPGYTAPEVLVGRPATPMGDLYAVGALLYTAATGSCPFRATDPRVLANLVRVHSPSPLHRVRPDLPVGLASLVHRALDKDPAERFATAQTMAAALASIDAPPNAAARRDALDPPTAPLVAERGRARRMAA